jgi:transposase-like protein
MRAPVLAVGDGALAFWKVQREVFPDTKEQRCWFHVQGDVLAALPTSANPGYGAKWPKATAKIIEHLDVLFAFYYYPAEHWIHLRTTNPIESTVATVRLRQPTNQPTRSGVISKSRDTPIPRS